MTEHPDTITIAKCHPFRGDNFYITLTGSDRSGIEYIRADVAAAERDAAVAQALTVKPLEWEDADQGMCTKWRAAALGGRYELVTLDKEGGLFSVNFCWGRPLSFWFIQGDRDEYGPTGPKKFTTLEAAKAAAQADYKARVLSALIPAPAGKEGA